MHSVPALLIVINVLALVAIVFLSIAITRRKAERSAACLHAFKQHSPRAELTVDTSALALTAPSKNQERYVVCFLTRKITEEYARTGDLLVKDVSWITAYVIVDEEDAESKGIPLLYASKLMVREKDCLNKFYTHLNWFKPVCAWAKCLYALNYVVPETVAFRYAWIIEDDCAFASVSSFRTLIETYSRDSDADLIATHIETRDAAPSWINWYYKDDYFITPTPSYTDYKSFNVLMRISKKLLAACDASIQKHKKAAFLEVFFINVCVQAGLQYRNAIELNPHLSVAARNEDYLQHTHAPVFGIYCS